MTEDVFASVDLGGTKIACALATTDGQVLAEHKTPTQAHEGPAAVLARIGALVEALSDEVGRRPAALGMGIPGEADIARGSVKFLPNLPTQWRGVPVADVLEPRLGCPIYLLNDVRAATLGELVYGHGRQVGNLAFFAVGTGIGGGFTIDGHLHLGPNGTAGEFGHHTIIPDGPRCGCGSRGCLETLCSGPAITAEGVRLLLTGQTTRLQELVNGDAGRVTPHEMALAAAAGDVAVRDILVRAAEYLGIGVANVFAILHPDLVVIGGSVAEIGPLLFDTVRATVRQRIGMFPADELRVEPSLLGNKAAMGNCLGRHCSGGTIGIS
ncbi:MAG: ROK family protein [Anaerolineales bacterium]|nr:ROK family protein [Anaerolineales bacterium]